MSTTLRTWLHQYISVLPSPHLPLPTAGSLQITDYSTEPPTSTTQLPRVTAIVSDGHLRIRAPVDDEALRAVRDSTPLPQWRGAIIALDNWTLSYTLDEFVLQLHAFHVLQAVGSSDIGSARHCMDDQLVRQTHTTIKQANTQQRRQLLYAQHATLFPNQPLPPSTYSVTQPIPAELAAVQLPSAELSFMYSVPEVCQQELDKLAPREGAGTTEMQQSSAGADEVGGVGLSQWSSGSDEKDEKDQEYFSQYAGIRPPILPLPRLPGSALPLFPPLISAAPSTSALSSASASTASAVIQPHAALLTPSKLIPASASLLSSQPTPHNAIYSQLSLSPTPPQPQQTQTPASPTHSIASISSLQPAEDALHLPPASQHNMMETSLERDAMLMDAEDDSAAVVLPPSQPSQPSQAQLAQPRDDEQSLLSSQSSRSSQLSAAEVAAAVEAEMYVDVDDGFFMTQAPSVSEYASQLAASHVASDGEMGSDDDVAFSLYETDKVVETETAEAAGVPGASGAVRTYVDLPPASMPPLSPGPPSPTIKAEEREESKEKRSVADGRAEVLSPEAASVVGADRRDGNAAGGVGHFSAEMIAQRQRVRNAELLRQRESEVGATMQGHEQAGDAWLQQESKQEEPPVELDEGGRQSERVLAKRGGSSSISGGGSERADKRQRSVRFDDERNTQHEARDDGSDGSGGASESGQSLADLLRGVSVEEVAKQPIAASFDGWDDDDFAWHRSYWTAVQL